MLGNLSLHMTLSWNIRIPIEITAFCPLNFAYKGECDHIFAAQLAIFGFKNFIRRLMYGKPLSESESDVIYGQVWWPILGICALHLTHPKCTHTAVNTHTPWTHPEQWGVRCLAQGHLSRGIEGGESAVHSLPPPTIPARPETRTRNLRITSPTL